MQFKASASEIEDFANAVDRQFDDICTLYTICTLYICQKSAEERTLKVANVGTHIKFKCRYKFKCWHIKFKCRHIKDQLGGKNDAKGHELH